MKKSMLIRWELWLFLAGLLSIPNPAFAGLLVPIDGGDLYTYNKHDSADPQNEWTFTLQGLEQVIVGGQQHINVAVRNEDGAGSYEEVPIRSTETAVYSEDGSILFQIAPVGTIWSYPSHQEGLGSGTNHNEITSIEAVTVPYGTFSNAYVHEVYFDPDDPSLANTPFWYEYVVPDVGWVKQIDYFWDPNGPAILELAQISTVPEPGTVPEPATLFLFGSGLFGFLLRRKN